ITTRTSSRLVPMISLRDFSGSSAGTMPAAARRGRVSSKMRPLERAMVIPLMGLFYPSNVGAQSRQLLLQPLVASVKMVDALDQGLTLRHQAGYDQAGRSAQVS